MFKFSCFSTPSLNQRSKRVRQLGSNMNSIPQQKSKDDESRVYFGLPSMDANVVGNDLSISSGEQNTSPSSHGDYWKSEYMNGDFFGDDGKEFLETTNMRKSYSLGTIIDDEKGFSDGDAAGEDGEADGLSFNYSHGNSMEKINYLLDGDTSPELYNDESLGINIDSQLKGNDLVHPFDMIVDNAHHESLFSFEVLKQFNGSRHVDDDEQSTDPVADFGCLSFDDHPIDSRTHSVSNFRMDSDNCIRGTETRKVSPRSISFESFNSLNEGTAEFHNGDEVLSPEVTCTGLGVISDSGNLPQELDEEGKDLGKNHLLSDRSDGIIERKEAHENDLSEWFDFDNRVTIDRFRSRGHITSANESKQRETVEKTKSLHLESSTLSAKEVNPAVFSIRRIEEWISQIDTENGIIVEEAGESSCTFSSEEPPAVVSIPIIKTDGKSNLGTEVAYNYISSLTAASSSAQMVNLGLTAVPLLSAFTGLRMLNLSGNSIVRITTGSLPRGLDMLNLSKNNITVIEGLRDLTRLRVLDLSYNQIVRIGRGLGSCSSLKELYLSGNKISDIEGLHRLVKLSTLDLRGNKISTAKGLSHLAANNASLQAINLEGNPAQRNVGDEQLKKYLLSLLPNLVYYNKQAIKASSAKEISDRSSRPDTRMQKLTRRGSHVSGLPKLALHHVRSSPALNSLLKQAGGHHVEGRHLHLRPIGSKPPKHLPDTERKPKPDGVLRANGALDRWENLVSMGLGGSMAAVLSRPPDPYPFHPHR